MILCREHCTEICDYRTRAILNKISEDVPHHCHSPARPGKSAVYVFVLTPVQQLALFAVGSGLNAVADEALQATRVVFLLEDKIRRFLDKRHFQYLNLSSEKS